MGGGAASTPFVVDDVLYVGGPKGVYSLGVENGDVLWFYETSVQCGSSPTAWSGSTGQARIAIGCEDGYAYIFEVET
jgi:outer membrane protein assembly factor BamB